jgi:L-serine/L-threonine ammonia-lyase
MSKAVQTHGSQKPIHFYCSSGGNAGLACATAASSLGRPATIVVPKSTLPLMVEKLKKLGVEVVQMGRDLSEADSYLRQELLAKDKDGVYVPPYDHRDIWEGNGTLVCELENQMRECGGYDAIVCSVGGGGLFVGIMRELQKHGRLVEECSNPVKVLAMETEGTDSLSYSLKRRELSRLPGITSIATSLGATQVAKEAFVWAQRPEVTSHVLCDAAAAMGSVCFADDERILVEAACGVSIAPAYDDSLHRLLFPCLTRLQFSKQNIVIVVCGGSNVTLKILEQYKEVYSENETVINTFRSTCLAKKLRKVHKAGYV